MSGTNEITLPAWPETLLMSPTKKPQIENLRLEMTRELYQNESVTMKKLTVCEGSTQCPRLLLRGDELLICAAIVRNSMWLCFARISDINSVFDEILPTMDSKRIFNQSWCCGLTLGACSAPPSSCVSALSHERCACTADAAVQGHVYLRIGGISRTDCSLAVLLLRAPTTSSVYSWAITRSPYCTLAGL
ncbi:hypothetical protein FIBSPDRAFT_892273 [Athelia psychrophila]|uniref:Uncharacterized protein n=1 Tax=Athelia psychrophila TaxID=1759441 RepID=A0A166IRX8_9AGAM|nr:hypothetical protein FIBSPDRAFT_892273 [Fibularhizoctonia sp. CBS 109695]